MSTCTFPVVSGRPIVRSRISVAAASAIFSVRLPTSSTSFRAASGDAALRISFTSGFALGRPLGFPD